MLLRLTICFFVFAACTSKSHAQKATAPNGYYPAAFHGAIFTGAVESVRTDVQELTLTYMNGKKTEQFVGKLQSACTWKDKGGANHITLVADLPKGAVLTAYYIPMSAKVNGVKTEENFVFALSYAEANGKKIPDHKRVVIYCSEQQLLVFKAF
jgi:hypothetical protein